MKRHWLLLVLSLLLLFAGLITVISGTPARLPGVAMGSSAFLYAVRGFALFVIGTAVVAVLVHGAQGHLPVEVTTRGFRYELREKEVSESELYGDVVGQLESFAVDLAGVVDVVRGLEKEIAEMRQADVE